MKESIFYRFPRLYLWGLRFLHHQAFAQRYRYIASFVRPGDSVLEPGCGPAPLAKFLPPKSHYFGFDTNQYLLKYAQKQGLSVFLGNALNPQDYQPADIIVACDLLHHLPKARRSDFIKLAWKSSRKMAIICEPAQPDGYQKHHGIWQNIMHWLAEWSERDGQNFVRWDSYYSRRQLLTQIKQGFKIIPKAAPRHWEKIGEDIITVFFKDRRSYRQFYQPKTVSAIVPVYNEEKTVAKVVRVLLASPLIREVIVVNDGSTDRSLSILQQFQPRIRLINLHHNHGKGFALATGVKAAVGEIVIFLDADLINLNQNHISTLLSPLLNKQARAVVGLPGGKASPWSSFFDYLGGQRAYYRRDLLPLLSKMRQARFGVEILLNKRFKAETTKVRLVGLRVLLKYQKRSPTIAVKEYLQEAGEVAWGFAQTHQIVPSDLKIIRKLRKISNVNEFRKISSQIRNHHIRQFLNKYVISQLDNLLT